MEGIIKHENQISSSNKESLDPHDNILIDVIKALEPSTHYNLNGVQTGDLVLIRGSLYILDKQILIAGLDIGKFADEMEQQGKKLGKRDKTKIAPFEIMKRIIDASPGDARFILLTEDEKEVTGSLKTQYMLETAASMCAKYRGGPILSCFVHGIIESLPVDESDMAANPFPPGSIDFPAIETLKVLGSLFGRRPYAYALRPVSISYGVNIKNGMTCFEKEDV